MGWEGRRSQASYGLAGGSVPSRNPCKAFSLYLGMVSHLFLQFGGEQALGGPEMGPGRRWVGVGGALARRCKGSRKGLQRETSRLW